MPQSAKAVPAVRRRLAAITASLAILFVIGGLTSAGAASAEDNDGVGITVTVAPTDANTPGSDAGPGGGSSSGGGSSPGGGSGTGDGSTPAPEVSSSPSATPKPGDVDLGGVLYLSGLTSDYVWSMNPARSVVMLHITLRNVSKSTFNSTARFWIDSTLGNTVSELKSVRIDRLRMNETRVVTVRMKGLGQWTVLQAHATITPPKSVDGISLAPITRDTYVFVPPLLVGGIGLFGICTFLLGKSLFALRLAARAKGIL